MNKEINIKKNINNNYLISIYILSLILIIATRAIVERIGLLININLREFVVAIIIAFLWICEIAIITIIARKKLDLPLLNSKVIKTKQLSTVRISILTLIILISILVISSQINWQVKPFYELGFKFTKFDLLGDIGQAILNCVKCTWIILLISMGQDLLENIFNTKRIIWGGLLLLITFGSYELIAGINELSIVYFILNLVFGLIYLLTDKKIIESFLIILFIYIF